MRKIFPACCASAIVPHTTIKKAITESPAHFRFSILRQGSGQVLDFGLPEQEPEARFQKKLLASRLLPRIHWRSQVARQQPAD